jgi:hypothetical protein
MIILLDRFQQREINMRPIPVKPGIAVLARQVGDVGDLVGGYQRNLASP